MATVTEKRVVEIVVDARQFKAATKDINRNLAGIRKQATRTADTFRGMFSAFALFEAARITKDFVRMTAEVERLDTVIRGAVGNQEDFADSMRFLRNTADDLGLRMSDLQKGYANLAGAGRAMGMSMVEINELFTGLSVSAAAFQVSGSELRLMLQGAQQLAGSATVNMEDLRQVMERIPNAMNAAVFATREVSGNLSLTSGEMRKLIAEGKVATDEFLPLFTQRLYDINFEAATQNSELFTAQLNRLDTAFDDLLRTLIEAGLLKALGDMASELVDLVKYTNDLVRGTSALFEVLSQDNVVISIANAFSALGAEMDRVAATVPAIMQFWNVMTDPAGTFLGGAVRGMKALGDEAQKTLEDTALHNEHVLAREQYLIDQIGINAIEPRTVAPVVAPVRVSGGGGGGGGGGRSAASTAEADAAKELERQTEALMRLQEQLDPSLQLWREYTEAVVLLDNAQKAGLVTQQQFTETERLLGEQLQENLAGLEETAEDLPGLALDIGNAFSNTFASMITGATSFENALATLERSLIDVITQALILEPLKKGIGAAFGGGDIFEAAFGGGIAALLGRQSGGPVQAGRPYMVGERGAEVIIPHQSGRVVPNNQLGGGQTIVVNFNAPVQGEGLRQSAQQIAAQVGAQSGRAMRRNG